MKIIGRPGVRLGWLWGLCDQGLSSLTNFLLVLLVARRLGASALGSVAVGFAAFSLVLVSQRALIGEPLVVTSEGSTPEDRTVATARGEVLTVLLGLAGSLVVLGLGYVVGGAAGLGLRVFAPWIAPAVLQDYWRAVLFRDHRGRQATTNDILWALVMAALAPLGWRLGTVWAVVAVWGSGALAGAVLGHWQVRPTALGSDRSALRWMREGWALRSWFLLDKAALNAGTQGGLFLLAGLVPPAALGGLRGTQSVFAPLTVLGPAVGLPGLPAVTRRAGRSLGEARRTAAVLSVLTVGGVIAYVSVLFALGRGLLELLFGSGFGGFSNLILPVAVGQVAMAAGTGFVLLLKAQRAGRVLFLSDAAGAVTALVAAWLLASRWGIVGGAWGLAAGMAVATTLAAAGAFRDRPAAARPRPASAEIPAGDPYEAVETRSL